MYIATIPNRSSPPAVLLRESVRDGKNVKTRTLANLTSWPSERVLALKRCLKGEFDHLPTVSTPICDRCFGVLFVLKELAQRVGLVQALGQGSQAKLALFLVLARVAHQGSRLSAVRWAEEQAVAEVLGLAAFDEDALYGALDWLAEQQERIEQALYRHYVNRVGQTPVLVLYDVTSSYFEGSDNELAAYGYNRDGKRGKKQIVIGLLTAADGEPLAIRVFQGNTTDCTTVATQIELLKQQFNIDQVVFVGDRGMVKAKGKQALTDERLQYITALTDPQVRALLKRQVLQPDLFDEVAQAVEHGSRRLVLRRNDALCHQQRQRRQDKLDQLQRLLDQRNALVQSSTRAQPEAGLRRYTAWLKRYKLNGFVTLSLQDRRLQLCIDEDKQAQVQLLDGCYVLETDVAGEQMDAATVDARYRDLQRVERDFRLMKTTLLELRPIFVRKANRTRGHVFCAMLALKIAREFDIGLKAAFGSTADDSRALTLADALHTLSRLCFQRYDAEGQSFLTLPQVDQKQAAIFNAMGIRPPQTPCSAEANM